MYYLIFFVCTTLFISSCGPGDEAAHEARQVQEKLSQLQSRYAPDRRTDRVAIELSGDTLSGYTTVATARDSLSRLIASHGLVDKVRLLPESPAYGLVRVSVANIRTHPGHSEELTSQALMGTPVAILDRADGWYLIRTPDRYIAWLEEGAIATQSRAEVEAWFSSEQLSTCVPAQTTVHTQPNGKGKIVTELVQGNLVKRSGRQRAGYTEIQLPDGRIGWLPSSALAPYGRLSAPEAVDTAALLNTALAQTGRPYLWGGTSPKAMDCSGFTKTAYYLNGYVIPRDASQQVHAGEEVVLDEDFTRLRRGDLLFFGNLREDGSERITHVGFYLDRGRMLHAGADNDYITENSLVEGDADFAAHRRESLLKARRLRAGSPGVVPIDSAFRALYTKSSSR